MQEKVSENMFLFLYKPRICYIYSQHGLRIGNIDNKSFLEITVYIDGWDRYVETKGVIYHN